MPRRNASIQHVKYELWTPTIYGTGTAGSPTYDLQEGWYALHNDWITINCRVGITAFGSMAGSLRIGNLPFEVAPVGMNPDFYACAVAHWTGYSGGNLGIGALIPDTKQQINLYELKATAAASNLQETDIVETTFNITISGSYRIV